jgi:hypothetical protein
MTWKLKALGAVFVAAGLVAVPSAQGAAHHVDAESVPAIGTGVPEGKMILDHKPGNDGRL